MPRGRQLAPLTISDADRIQLQGLANSTTAHALALRARIILASAEGLTNTAVARRVGASPQAIGKWRKRYLDQGIEGLYDEARPGRPRTFDDEKIARVIDRALQDKPANANQWSTRSMGAAEGVSASTVSRWFRLYGVQPNLAKSPKLYMDPAFIRKVRDIVGLYVNPPDHAMALCVDKKPQAQATDPTGPRLSMDIDPVEGYTHDDLRHGSTTLFAALDVATGKVITEAKPRNRHLEFLAFLRLIDKEVPANLDIHLVLDNHASRKHGAVKLWLGERPRYHLHFIPTFASWLDQVERWFGLLSEKSLNRDRQRVVPELVDQIRAFSGNPNEVAKPFAWVATSQSILESHESFSSEDETALRH